MNLIEKIKSGDSYWVFGFLLVVSFLICIALGMTKGILSDWAFEPIVTVPKQYQQIPLVKKWFEITRGFNYIEKDETLNTYKRQPTAQTKTPMDCLFSGWGFCHFLMHFYIALMCPKLVPTACMIGIGWEIFESYWNMHCTLDIVWNLCGSLCGLLVRPLVFGIS